MQLSWSQQRLGTGPRERLENARPSAGRGIGTEGFREHGFHEEPPFTCDSHAMTLRVRSFHVMMAPSPSRRYGVKYRFDGETSIR